METTTAERFIHTLEHAERTGDVGPLAALFSDDAELSNLVQLEPQRGREGAREFWHRYLSAFRHVHSRFTHVIEADNTVVLEWVAEGVLPSGTPLNYRGVSVLEERDGQLRRFRTYYDTAAFVPTGAKGRARSLAEDVS